MILLLTWWIPVGVQARYDEDGPLVQARLAWIRLTVFPRKKKQAPAAGEPSEKERKKAEKKKQKALQKKLKKDKKKQKQDQEESLQEPKKKGGSLDLILELVQVGAAFLGSFRRKLVVENIDVLVRFGGTDPCKIAINYGRAWAGIGCLNPLLENTFKIKKRNLRAEISDDVKSVDVIAALSLYIRIYRIFAMGLRYGWQVLRIFLRDKRKKKKLAKQQARALRLEAAAQK